MFSSTITNNKNNENVSFLLLFVLFQLLPFVGAICAESNEVCQLNSGSCSSAVLQLLQGNRDGVMDSLSYGKYCGATNKCLPITSENDDLVKEEPAENLCLVPKKSKKEKDENVRLRRRRAKGSSGGGDASSIEELNPCPVDSCDEDVIGIDTACRVHDACLDELRANDPTGFNGERIPTPQRCVCDVPYVANLAAIARAGQRTELCDAAFYTAPILFDGTAGIDLVLGSEANLLAAPFCCDILRDTDGDKEPDCFSSGADHGLVGAATKFCGVLVTLWLRDKIDICKM